MSKLRDSLIELHDDFEDKEGKSEQQILNIYSKNLIDLKKYVATLFEKYEDDGKLKYGDMVKYNRLDKMDETLKGITVSLYKQCAKEVSNTLNTTYTDAFNGTSEAIQKVLGKKSLIAIIKDEEIKRAATNEISGLKWTDRMGLHREYAVSKIRETLVKGLHDGETYAQMANRLDDALGKDVVNSIRIVRRESHRVFSEARKDRLDKIPGINMEKEWVTSMDENVRSNHKTMNGRKVPYNDNFVLPNGNSGFGPGMIGTAEDDINCRCFWIVDFVY